MNCVQTNLFMPYLCHVNLLSLIMFKTNQPIKETMNKNNSSIKHYSSHIAELVKNHTNPILNKSNDFDNLNKENLLALLELVELINDKLNVKTFIKKLKGGKQSW